ncbi:MAG: hypothetical protein ACR2ID_05540 [Chthoniobacterales bacterium]
MTAKQFFDWQTAGGANDVTRLIDALEKADVAWCAIGGVAVNHWAREPMVTQDLDFVVAAGTIDEAVAALERAGLRAERFDWSVNFAGDSQVSMQLSTESFYQDFPARAVAAVVHGILLRVAALEDTLNGKIKAWSDARRRQSKQLKDLADIARLVEAHPALWEKLPSKLQERVNQPKA